MTLLQQPIERKLSALLGEEVTFEQLKVSLLAGSIEFVGLKVGNFITAARGVAKVAVSRALKGEIVVRSLTIERPVVHIEHLPKRAKPVAKSKSPAKTEEDKTRWTFDVERVLIIDGQVNISPRLALKKLLLELKR